MAAWSPGVVRRPATVAERERIEKHVKTQRSAAMGVSFAGLALSIGYYAFYSGFLLQILAFGFVIGGAASAANAWKARKALASGEVVELRGFVEKLGESRSGNQKGRAYALQIGADRVTVPLAVYDKFAPRMPGSLTIVEAASLAIAANGEPLALPVPMRWVTASAH